MRIFSKDGSSFNITSVTMGTDLLKGDPFTTCAETPAIILAEGTWYYVVEDQVVIKAAKRPWKHVDSKQLEQRPLGRSVPRSFCIQHSSIYLVGSLVLIKFTEMS